MFKHINIKGRKLSYIFNQYRIPFPKSIQNVFEHCDHGISWKVHKKVQERVEQRLMSKFD